MISSHVMVAGEFKFRIPPNAAAMPIKMKIILGFGGRKKPSDFLNKFCQKFRRKNHDETSPSDLVAVNVSDFNSDVVCKP